MRSAARRAPTAAPYALVAWHDGPVGVDIERVLAVRHALRRVDHDPGRARSPALDDDREIISLWSGKEALAKALGDAVDV